MLEVIDRFKYGIIAVFACYGVIFVYTNMITYDYPLPPDPFMDYAEIDEPEKAQEITPDKIEVPDNYDIHAANQSQNVHDDRQESLEMYSDRRSPQQIAQDIQNLESQMQKESGGSAERAKLQALIDERKAEQKRAEQDAQNGASSLPTSNNKYAGTTMVSYDLSARKAHNDNDWYVRNPGYTCQGGSGVVVIDVKANKNGDVISAVYNSGASRNASSCMINKALEYAKISRFEYSSNSSQQTGYIKYTFVSK